MSTNSQYKTKKDSDDWSSGDSSTPILNSQMSNKVSTASNKTKFIFRDEDRSVFSKPVSSSYELKDTNKNGIPSNGGVHNVYYAKFNTILDDEAKALQLYNEDRSVVQNNYNYPVANRESSGYNYQIIPGDSNYTISYSLEDKLRDMRAALGIPVHGRPDLARVMKYYMYNRFKVPDLNMAHTKTFTHVFFSRPDCNLLSKNGSSISINEYAGSNVEVYMLWARHPELFKLLTNGFRYFDNHNFNLLLSNQVSSFDITDETLSTVEAGKSWNQYEMVYGDTYSGRFAGEFSCNFEETNDLSVMNLIKLWITYIDAVSRGVWSPSYNLTGGSGISRDYNGSHAYTKTLDYASSCDIFVVGPDGEQVLYWSKYYGIFPVNTGASALSWSKESGPNPMPKLNIRFKYSFKRDLSPISLLEFNNNSSDDNTYIPAFDKNSAGTARPFVGAPYIEMKMPSSVGLTNPGISNLNSQRLDIRLKFNRFTNSNISDNDLYKPIRTSSMTDDILRLIRIGGEY